jgi:hypothetical protein
MNRGHHFDIGQVTSSQVTNSTLNSQTLPCHYLLNSLHKSIKNKPKDKNAIQFFLLTCSSYLDILQNGK